MFGAQPEQAVIAVSWASQGPGVTQDSHEGLCELLGVHGRRRKADLGGKPGPASPLCRLPSFLRVL
jgi:hypothetical protein